MHHQRPGTTCRLHLPHCLPAPVATSALSAAGSRDDDTRLRWQRRPVLLLAALAVAALALSALAVP